MSESRAMPAFTKSSPELQDAFRAALEAYPDAERRQMFGYPAAFANGNMWTGLFKQKWIVRLTAADRDELLALPGALPFEPAPGRPMTGFYALPDDVVADPGALRHWLDRAWQAGLAMPPNRRKRRSRRNETSRRCVGGRRARSPVDLELRPADAAVAVLDAPVRGEERAVGQADRRREPELEVEHLVHAAVALAPLASGLRVIHQAFERDRPVLFRHRRQRHDDALLAVAAVVQEDHAIPVVRHDAEGLAARADRPGSVQVRPPSVDNAKLFGRSSTSANVVVQADATTRLGATSASFCSK